MSLRIAIVGAGGGVGSSAAFNLLLRDPPYAVDLVESRSGLSASHRMDLEQVVAAGASGSVDVVEAAAIRAADVVVVSAAAPLTTNRSRRVYLQENARVLDGIVAALGDPPASWPGVLLVVTNPVDALVTRLVRHHGLDRRRVIGYTANDSLRLRTAVGSALGVEPGRVDAWVLGEHGDACVPLLSRLAVDGVRVELDAEQRADAEDFVRSWYRRHVALDSSRSSTWTTGHGVARMIDALLSREPDPWPAAVTAAGAYGIQGDVAITVPVTLGPGGVEEVLEWELAPSELRALRAAARAVEDAVTSL